MDEKKLQDFRIIGTDHGVFVDMIVSAESKTDAAKDADIQCVQTVVPV